MVSPMRALRRDAAAGASRPHPGEGVDGIRPRAFPTAVGIAAGFDKNAEAVDPLLRLGFGFVEIGSVTPRPQAGNPRPRLFRLPADHGVINRFGFNNDGHAGVHARLLARHERGGIVGVNVGANKDSEDKAADYAAGIAAFADLASYFTINVSSPNTPGLRDLQQREALDDLLARIAAARDEASRRWPRRPLLLKIAPDLSLGELDDVVAVALARGMDGMVVSNTTIARPATLRDEAAGEGGGRPVGRAALRALDDACWPRRRSGSRGGFRSSESAESIPPRRPARSSRPARRWSSSIRRWSIAGRGWSAPSGGGCAGSGRGV